MTGKRKRYGAEFKARVALEALRGELTTAQLAAWPTTVTKSRWPRALTRSTQKPLSGLW